MAETQPVELDPGTPEIDLSQIKKRSVGGVVALTSRTFFIQVISFAATFGLTVFLSPQAYGTFFLVSAVVNFLTYFSDIGLAAALIQKKKKVSRRDLTTTFTIQQALVLLLVIVLFAATPLIKSYYQLSSAGIYLLWALGISLVFSSLKTIPSVLLERKLHFDKLVIPQILENLAFNLSAVYFAWQGWGVTSFTFAVLLRGIVGLIAMYIVSPWQPALSFSRKSFRKLLRFGLPYQANTFLAVLKDDGMTIFLGKIIGQQGLGFIGWASKWAFMPLRFFMDNVTKVAFPAYSRVQDEKETLKKGIEKTLFYLSFVCFPLFVGMGVLAEPFAHLIPRYEKWLPALIPLYFYLFNAAWASVSTPLTNALNAIGKIKTTFKLMVMWVLLTWALMPLLGSKFGYQGVSAAAALIALSSVVVLIIVRRLVPVNYFRSLFPAFIASFLMGGVLFVLRPYLTTLWRLPVFVLLGGLVYLAIIYLIEGRQLFTEIKTLLLTLKPDEDQAA